MSRSGLQDSKDPWKYFIVMSKFMLHAINAGFTKSLGVLIPEMVSRYNSDYKTMAFICGLPIFMYAASPIAHLLTKIVRPRRLGIFGGLLLTVSIACAPLTNSVFILAIMLVSTGIGFCLSYVPVMISLNDFFPEAFVFTNTLTQFGSTCGAFTTPVILERSLEAYGYQGAFLILGGISLHALICAACIRKPNDLHEVTKSLRANNETVSDKQQISTVSWLKSLTLFKEPLFTLILPSIFLEGFVMHAWMLFLVPHAECLGTQRSQAVLLSAIAGISGIFGKLSYLVLLHFNVNTTVITFFSCLVFATSFFLDPFSSTFTSLSVTAVVQGFVVFLLNAVLPGLLKLSVRKESNVPSAIPIMLSVHALGMICGDVTSGHIFDVSSSCSTLFISQGIILLAIMVNLLIFFLADKYFNINMHI